MEAMWRCQRTKDEAALIVSTDWHELLVAFAEFLKVASRRD